MPDQEKVIQGLSCLSTDADYEKGACDGCPYFVLFGDDDGMGFCEEKRLAADALELIRKQATKIRELSGMAEFNIETVIKSGVEKALNDPFSGGKSIAEWVAIGMKAPRWINVNDRLPANNSHVIVYDEGSKMVWPSHYMDATFYEENDVPYFTYHVNWWIPLPEKPEEVSKHE